MSLPIVPAAVLVSASSNAEGDFHVVLRFPNGRRLIVAGGDADQEWIIEDSLGFVVASGWTRDCEAQEAVAIAVADGGFALV